jgi:hypothetical protein
VSKREHCRRSGYHSAVSETSGRATPGERLLVIRIKFLNEIKTSAGQE